jgi:hypothetical protein
MGGKRVWVFDLPRTGQVAFLHKLRWAMAGREMTCDEVYRLVCDYPGLEDVAMTGGLRKLDPLSNAELMALLRASMMVPVEGYVLTRKRGKFWLFVKRN